MAQTQTFVLTAVWTQVSTVENTVLLELDPNAEAGVEWLVAGDDEFTGDEDVKPCHRLNRDQPVASLYGLATDGYVIWARAPSTLVNSVTLIVSAY